MLKGREEHRFATAASIIFPKKKQNGNNRFAAPRSNEVAVSPVGHQHRGWRLDTRVGGESQVSIGGAAEDSDLGSVLHEIFRAIFPDPFKSILHARNDLRQLGFRGKPIINGNHHVTRLRQLSSRPNALTATVDQRPAMDPYRERPNLFICRSMSV